MTALTIAPEVNWLLNPQSYRAPDSNVLLLAAGYDWDAARTPEQLGLATAGRLLADAHDRPLLGPVLHSRRSECLYWIVRNGSTAHYRSNCQLLGKGNWIAVPGIHALHPDTVRWLHLPEAGVLTPAAWLAAALHDTRLPGGTR